MSETTDKTVTREYVYPKQRYQYRALEIADLAIRFSDKSIHFTGDGEQRGCEQAHGKALEHLAAFSDTIFTIECKLVDAKEALSKAEAELAGVRAGTHVIVPREPTIEMENAGGGADHDYSNNRFRGLGHLSRVAFIYNAMLAASEKERKA